MCPRRSGDRRPSSPIVRASGFVPCALLALTAFTTFGPAVARAEVNAAVQLEYRAPASCPDAAAMFSRLRTRLDVRPAANEETARALAVTITPRSATLVGTVTAFGAHGEMVVRTLASSDCVELVDALALVASIVLRPAPGDGRDDSAAEDVDARTPDGVRAPSAPTAPRPAALRPAADLASRADAARARQASDAAAIKLLVGADEELIVGFVPGALLGTAVRLAVHQRSGGRVVSTFSLGVVATLPRERSVPEGTATLRWMLGQLSACRAALRLGSSVSLLACARVDLGRVSAVGRLSAPPGGVAPASERRDRWWLSAGPVAQLLWSPGGPLVVHAQTGALVPLTPYEFVFEPSSVVYPAPRVGFAAAIGVAVSFL
jgi:hypothetical protein